MAGGSRGCQTRIPAIFLHHLYLLQSSLSNMSESCAAGSAQPANVAIAMIQICLMSLVIFSSGTAALILVMLLYLQIVTTVHHSLRR